MSFSEIKRRLDLAFSYIVFEKKEEFASPEDFLEIGNLLSRFEQKVTPGQVYWDVDSKRSFYIIKVNPQDTELVIEECLKLGLATDSRYYVYRSSDEIRNVR